jgi:hypothetical protein
MTRCDRQQQGIGTQSDQGLGCGCGCGSGYGGSDPQGMPALTGNVPWGWGKRPLRPLPPLVRNRTSGRAAPQRAKNGFGCPLRIPELARARSSLRCAPFKCSWCMGGIRCVTIYRFFGAGEMDFGPQRSPTSKYDFELEKRALYALEGEPL